LHSKPPLFADLQEEPRIGLGQVKIEKDVYFVISPDSPIGALLMNKKIQDTFQFNQKTYEIQEIV